MNDFAKTQLMKYGWTEGKGLGKHESGIIQPVRPKLKFDTAGVGHKDTDWNNWWESGFNKAANSIAVESQNQGVSISVTKESANDDFSKKNSNEGKSKYSTGYNNFLKTSTLLNGTLTAENNSNVHEGKNVKEDIAYVPLTDEELFKVCGGRTVHKGARHGLTLSGKLTRIAQQEESLLNTNSVINMSRKLHNNNNEFQDDKDDTINSENMILPITFTKEEMVPKVSKTAKRRDRKQINYLSHQLNTLCNLSDNNEKIMHARAEKKVALKQKDKGRKRKRKEEQRESVISFDDEGIEKGESDNELDDISLPVNTLFGKGVIKTNAQKQANDHSKQECNDACMHRKKKGKKLRKKKNANNQYGNMTSMWEDEEPDGLLAKKLKRSYKSDSDVQFLIEDKNSNTSEGVSKIKFPWNEEPVKSHKTRHLPVGTTDSLSELSDTCFKKRTAYLNAKIKKKKQTKLRKKEEKTLAHITKSLETVHFNTKESTEERSTKKKLNTVVEKLVASDTTTNRTEHLKKNKKRNKRKKTY